jgi:RNA polymerase-binding transcription factor DksA
MILGRIICRIKGHKELITAGSCPFTGSTYDYCERCGAMIPREVAE